jgi:TIR domain
MDAFISHSSEDASIAQNVHKILFEDGLRSWLDFSNLSFGFLLRDELIAAIRGSRVLVLLWSKAASKSQWVASELLTAFHMGHFVIPVTLDKTRLPQFLQNTVYLDIGRLGSEPLANLPRAVREAPDAANKFSPIMANHTLEQSLAAITIGLTQRKELALMPGDDARETHAEVDGMIRDALKKWKYDALILAESGYHLKNAYLLKHWAAYQAGRPPQDQLLARAETRFFETLFVNPEDPSALNGLGSILMLQREPYAAEFFILRALEMTRRKGQPYPEAEHDLALVRRFLPERAQSETAVP